MADIEPIEKSAAPKAATGVNELADLYTNFNENTLFKSPLVEDSYRPPYPVDALWQKTGDFSIYEKMGFDDQVSVCLQLKKDLVLGEGGHFVPGDEGQDEMIDDLEHAFFEDYEGEFNEDLEQILTGYEFGFSITEKIFKQREGGMLGLKYLRTRHPNSWRLYQDDKGSVSKFEQVTVKGNLDVNPKSIVHYVNNPRFQNPYGTSDLRAAYNAYFAKTECVKYLAIFLEKAASPVPVGRFDKNAPQSAVDKLFEILKRFQTKTAIVIPKDIEVEFLEAKNTGEAYIKAIHLFNMFIGRALFIPDLVGFTGAETGGGSLALGKEQMNLFFMHIYRRRNALEAIINRQFVLPMVQYNHGLVPKYPKFRFKPLDDMKAVELAKIWLEAVKGKTWEANPDEINHFRKLVKFPEGDVNMPAPQPNPLTGLMPGEEGEDNGEAESSAKGNKDAEESNSRDDEGSKEEASGKPKPKVSNFAKAYNYPEGDYHKKVDFKAIETKLNDYDASVSSETRPVVKKIIRDLIDQIAGKKILQTGNADRIDSLVLKNKKELKQILKASFVQIYKDAKVQAANEINKSGFTVQTDFAKKAVSGQKFLDLIEKETFDFVGDYEYGILKRVRAELISAIKDGKALASIEDILDRDLNKMSKVQIERYARTKHTEVLNTARVEFFQDTGVIAGYQYSAVLDDTTTDICGALHGKKFTAGDEPIPPLHFNCRSLLVPITKFEEFKPTESIKGQAPDAFIEENKGEGFSKFRKQDAITDPGVDMELKVIDELNDVYVYSKNGNEFCEVALTYSDETKTTIVKTKTKRLDEAPIETGI